jgi:hypothetical protein
MNKGKRRILFDRPKPRAGCSANGGGGRRRKQVHKTQLKLFRLLGKLLMS